MLLLGCELVEGVDVAPPDLLAGRVQLVTASLREGLEPQVGERVVCAPELGASVDAAALAAQPLAVQQLGPGELDAQPGPGEPFEGLEEPVLGCGVAGQECLGARHDAASPVGVASGGCRPETVQSVGSEVRLPAAGGGLSEVGQTLGGERAEVALSCPNGGLRRLGISPEPQVQDGRGSVRDVAAQALPA